MQCIVIQSSATYSIAELEDIYLAHFSTVTKVPYDFVYGLHNNITKLVISFNEVAVAYK
jgi:hypothetical protein